MKEMMMVRRLKLGAALVATAVLLTSGCGATAKRAEPGSSAPANEPIAGLRFMVPNTAGSGYDTTAREAAKVMDAVGATKNIEVFNLAGAGGTTGLARTVSEKGNGKLLMMMGLGGGRTKNKYKTITDLVKAWKANPKSLAVGGGSSPGGPDHLLPMQLAQAVGINPKDVNYVAYDGGGELLPAVLGAKVAFGASGYGEFLDQVEAGEVRVLATSGAERVKVFDAPTLKESGIDLEFTNWRGVVAPPELSDADKQALVNAVAKMHDSQEWKQVLTENDWADAYLTADEFSTYMTDQSKRVEDVLSQLGLA